MVWQEQRSCFDVLTTKHRLAAGLARSGCGRLFVHVLPVFWQRKMIEIDGKLQELICY
jgi:hypothetical protein